MTSVERFMSSTMAIRFRSGWVCLAIAIASLARDRRPGPTRGGCLAPTETADRYSLGYFASVSSSLPASRIAWPSSGSSC